MSQIWHLVLLWGIVVGIGTGMTALVMAAIVSTRWFTERRGLVLGMLTASSATGQLAFLPLAAWLESHYGWRWALAPSLIGMAVAAVAVLLFMVDRPADVGLVPYGETGKVAPPAPLTPAFSTAFRVLREVSGSGAFWVLAGTFFICGLSTNGLIQTHFISLCADFGVASVTAASMLAMMGIFDFFGTIASGWLSDRYDNRALLFMYYGLRGLSLLYLPGSSFSIYGLSLFAVFYGLDWIATVPPTVRLAASMLRPRARRRRLRLDLRRPHDRRRRRRLRRGLFAHDLANLRPRVLRRWRGLSRRGDGRLVDRPAAGAGGRARRGGGVSGCRSPLDQP